MPRWGGKPFLFHLFSRLRSQGIQHVILALGHFYQEVLNYLKEQPPEGLQVVPIIEDRPLGTGGAIRNAFSALHSDPVFVLNGDTYAEVPLQSLLTFHRKNLAAVTLAAAYKKSIKRYGSIEMDEAGRVLRFIEKGGDESGYVSTGVYVVSHRVIQMIPSEGAVSWEREVLPTLVGKDLFACCGSFRFLDIGTPNSYRRAAQFLER
ncbi:sugar phosphate nucleotidyltransferase [Acidobacteria bacterium AH-259-D05]|nr:sugar phosphate nucleotidyltransferase [Acidobacteria bacterium AH-259-D05]